MLILIQARMKSKRLPGKVLKECGGKPILQWVIERAKQNTCGIPVAVATSDESCDDSVERFCHEYKIAYYRGNHYNVLERYRDACSYFSATSCIRISADSPLIDPHLIDVIIKSGDYKDFDLVTNIGKRTFPKGQSVELIQKVAMDCLLSKQLTDEEKEHVTLGFYKRQKEYKINNISSREKRFADLQLSVDTEDDFKRVESLLEMQAVYEANESRLMSWEKLAKECIKLID